MTDEEAHVGALNVSYGLYDASGFEVTAFAFVLGVGDGDCFHGFEREAADDGVSVGAGAAHADGFAEIMVEPKAAADGRRLVGVAVDGAFAAHLIQAADVRAVLQNGAHKQVGVDHALLEIQRVLDVEGHHFHGKSTSLFMDCLNPVYHNAPANAIRARKNSPQPGRLRGRGEVSR